MEWSVYGDGLIHSFDGLVGQVDYAVGASTSDPADDPNFADELIDSRRLGKVDGPTSRRASVDDL